MGSMSCARKTNWYPRSLDSTHNEEEGLLVLDVTTSGCKELFHRQLVQDQNGEGLGGGLEVHHRSDERRRREGRWWDKDDILSG